MPRLTAEEAVGLLGDLGEGRMLDDLAETLSDVLDAVMATGKRGQVTIQVKIEPPAKGAPELAFAGTVRGSKPVVDAFAIRYWDGAHLHRHDPAQLALGEVLPAGARVDPDTGEIVEAPDAE